MEGCYIFQRIIKFNNKEERMRVQTIISTSLLISLIAITTQSCSSLTAEVEPEVILNDKNEISSVTSIPRYNMCILNAQCSALGAKWDANNPDEVTLLIQYKTGASLKKGTLIIDGYPVPLIGGEHDTNFDDNAGSYAGMRSGIKSATNAYKMPVEMFKRILSAKTVSIDVELTTAGKVNYYTDRISTETKKGGGYKALENLMKAIGKA